MNMNSRRNPDRFRLAFLGLALAVLFPWGLAAQNVPTLESGLDNDGRAVVSILPFVGEEEAANAFNAATSEAVRRLEKYSVRSINAQATLAFESGIPTDMPPVWELVPGSRYALTGGVYPGTYENEYYLQLWLWNMRNSTMIYSDDLVYQHIEEGLESLPGLVEWLFSHIVEVTLAPELPPEDPWPDTRFNVGVRSGVSQRWYTDPEENGPGAHALVYEGGVFASVFLNSLFSIQVEANFSFDNLVFRGITDADPGPNYEPVYANKKHSSHTLAFPLLFKANLKSRIFRFAPFAGVYVFIPLGKASYEENPTGKTESYTWSTAFPLGYAAGIETAVKCGPGILLADIRYGGDFGSIVMDDPGETSYKRGALSITLGYAFGFINIKK